MRGIDDSSRTSGRSRPISPTAALLVIGLVLTTSYRGTLGDEPPARSSRPIPSGAVFLEEIWPSHPEWAAMLADILVKGADMGGGDGWFRKGISQTRFGWEAIKTALDRDEDGAIVREEFSGPDADFARLDRDRDGHLTSHDFDFATPPPPSAGLLFGRADRDGNGKVTREEIDAFFKSLDPEGAEFLSLADVQQLFEAPPMTTARATGGPGSLTRGTFLRSFFKGELGALTAGPGLGEVAPDFTLKPVDGDQEVTLSKLVGPKPVILVFGNFTCGPFRGRAGDLETLHRRYRDRATFLMVYVREAHPTDGWRMMSNDRVGVAVRQPRSYPERVEVARTCSRALDLGFPMLVDTIDDAVNRSYSGIPSRFYVIDESGKVAFKGGRGPFGFKPAEMEQSLILLLNKPASRQSQAATRPAAVETQSPGAR